MPFCTHCGHDNPDDSRFCSHCGTALRPVLSDSTSTLSLGGASGLGIAEGEAESERDHVEAAHPSGLSPADQAAVDALPPGSALLVVRRGPNAGARFLLDADVTTAGRHPDSDIFLDDVTVSRRHAEFSRDGASFSVRDVGSLNGTYVNRSRIDDAVLGGGDEVQVGKYRLVFFPSQHQLHSQHGQQGQQGGRGGSAG